MAKERQKKDNHNLSRFYLGFNCIETLQSIEQLSLIRTMSSFVTFSSCFLLQLREDGALTSTIESRNWEL